MGVSIWIISGLGIGLRLFIGAVALFNLNLVEQTIEVSVTTLVNARYVTDSRDLSQTGT